MTLNTIDEDQICNIASTLISGKKINSISDPKNDQEATFAALYPMSRDTLLAKHPWAFANPDRTLAIDADAPVIAPWKNAFKLPSDLIAGPFAVYGDGSTYQADAFSFENRNDYIYSNFSTLRVSYRARPDVSIWPPYFVYLVATDLASLAAKPIKSDTALAEEMRIRAYGAAQLDGNGGLFQAAKNIDAQSKPMSSLFKNGDPLTGARMRR